MTLNFAGLFPQVVVKVQWTFRPSSCSLLTVLSMQLLLSK